MNEVVLTKVINIFQFKILMANKWRNKLIPRWVMLGACGPQCCVKTTLVASSVMSQIEKEKKEKENINKNGTHWLIVDVKTITSLLFPFTAATENFHSSLNTKDNKGGPKRDLTIHLVFSLFVFVATHRSSENIL